MTDRRPMQARAERRFASLLTPPAGFAFQFAVGWALLFWGAGLVVGDPTLAVYGALVADGATLFGAGAGAALLLWGGVVSGVGAWNLWAALFGGDDGRTGAAFTAFVFLVRFSEAFWPATPTATATHAVLAVCAAFALLSVWVNGEDD